MTPDSGVTTVLEDSSSLAQSGYCLDEARNGYEAGWQDVPVDFKGRYIDDVVAFAADIRGEKSPDRSLDHELVVQETVMRASEARG